MVGAGRDAVAGVKDAVQLVAGDFHDCVLEKDATVWCWGGDDFGQLGDRDDARPEQPARRVAGLGRVTQLAVCWGHDMAEDAFAMKYERKPAVIAGLDDAVQIAVGGHSACALRKDGEVACWGSNRYGQLGDGSGANQTLTTVRW